jgi:predicted AAA+ superfamily ATPase
MKRPLYLKDIEDQFRIHPVCALLGPRQVGKTTLANMFIEKHPKDKVTFFDLENPLDLARLDNPMLALGHLNDILIVIDEIQKRPELFPVLRVLVDEKNKNRRFLILGSASRDLINQSSETLAGRIGYIEVMPFSLKEVDNSYKLWLRGGFPRSYLSENEEDSFRWRQAYIATYLERDIPNLGFQIPAPMMRRFWLMLAHYHGQILNSSELGRSLGLSSHTIRRYLEILTGTFMVRLLTPWHENIGKRQVKSPKIYFRDSGIFHALLGLENQSQLDIFPKLGASWEGFAIEEIIREKQATNEDCFFWATQNGAELDLMIHQKGKRIGYEIKYNDAPKITASMKIALEDLKLDHLYIVYPGREQFPMSEKISALGLKQKY